MVDKSRRIPPGELSAYERWELPNLGDNNTAPSNRQVPVKKEKIKPLTAEDIEKIRQQAYDAGFEEGRVAGEDSGRKEGIEQGKLQGHKEGLAQGLKDGQSQIDQQVKHLKVLLAELSEPIAQQQDQVEQAILNVAIAISRAVIHRELQLDETSIKPAVYHILRDLPKADQGFVLTVNPVDKSTVQLLLHELESGIELQVDPSLTSGGCIMETANQLIDYTVEKRFQKTVQGMLSNAIQANGDSGMAEIPVSIDAISDYPTETLNEFQEAESDLGVSDSDFASDSESDVPQTSVAGSAAAELGESNPDHSSLDLDQDD